jgi:hypothetical protein
MYSAWPAALLGLLVACGDDGARELPDAPTTDGGDIVDAPPGGSVTVTAWAGNAVRDPDAIVLFQTASGSIASRVNADANGTATGDVPAGGMVTVVQSSRFTTIVQVAGGDEIAVGNNVASVTGTATVTLPTAPGGTTTHQVITPCGSGSSAGASVPVALFATCPQPAMVVGVARAGATAQAFLVESASITAGTTTSLGGAWATPVQFSATFENLPAFVTRAVAYASSRIGTTTLYAVPTELPAPSGGTSTGTLAVPPAFGDGTDLRYFVGRGFDAYQQGFESVSGTRTSHTFDGGTLLPWIETVEPTGNGVSWTQSSGDSYDGARVTFEFQYKGATQLEWHVIAPESARGITLPMLPNEIEIPKQAQELEVHVELIESPSFDYADMRTTGGTTSFRRDDTLPAIRVLRSSFL